MRLAFYNTMKRRVEPFTPLEPGTARVYCCGPTVYNFAHIGNLRAYVFEDTLRRTLELAGLAVRHVMNITDVGHLTDDADAGEDKMIVAMRREGKSAQDIANFYTEAFFRHAGMLNILRPHVCCKATEHIAAMIGLIRRLEERGLAYAAGGNVYFDIERFPSYGSLKGQALDELQAGARIEVDAAKRHPLDFALWFTQSKFDNQEMTWDSPWGRGYPGWHIECSAMAIQYLGEQIDIHCGGVDHVAIHHTNEIAQSEGATGKSPWVNVWMHGEWLIADNAKMSKSSGEFTTLDTLVARGYDPLAFRYLCLGAHYRQQLGFSYEALDGAANALKRLQRQTLALREEAGGAPAAAAPDHPRLAEFRDCLADDLNSPRALAAVWALLRDDAPAADKLGLLLECDRGLGLGLAALAPRREEAPAEVVALVEARRAARARKDFAESDRLRDAIAALGYTVRDTKDGAVIEHA